MFLLHSNDCFGAADSIQQNIMGLGYEDHSYALFFLNFSPLGYHLYSQPGNQGIIWNKENNHFFHFKKNQGIIKNFGLM